MSKQRLIDLCSSSIKVKQNNNNHSNNTLNNHSNNTLYNRVAHNTTSVVDALNKLFGIDDLSNHELNYIKSICDRNNTVNH